MKRFALTALIAVFAWSPVLAQPAPPSGPPPGPRETARTQAMAALSSDHQTKVSAILARVTAGQLTDARDAAKAIDAVLSPKESQSVLAARDKMLADLRDDGAGPGPGGGGPGPGDGGPPPDGGPGGGGPPPGGGPGMDGGGPPPEGRRHHGGHAMRNDPGFALLMLNLDRDQMRALFAP